MPSDAPPEANAAETTGSTIAGDIIDRFGGIRPMATKLGAPVTTVQGWKKRGIIPQARHAEILAAALREGVALDPAELAATDAAPGARAEPGFAEPLSPPDIAAPMPAPVIVRRGGAAAYAALLLSLVVGVGAGAAGFAAWQFYLRPLQTRVAALESRPGGGASDELVRRVAKLEAESARPPAASSGSPPPADGGAQGVSAAGDSDRRLAALESALAELKTGSARTDQLAKNLSDLQVAAGGRELLAQSIRDIQSSTAAAQGEVERLKATVMAFGGRLDQVDAALADKRQAALRAEATVLAVGQLRAALATARPFTKEIAALRGVAGADSDMAAALDPIQPFAETGIPTAADLTKDFARMAPVLVRSAVVGDGQSWWRQALYHIETVISIRRIGENTPGDSTDAVVARAEAKVDEGDLAGAINALRALSGLPAEMASSWIHDAGHRVAADAAADELDRIAIAHIGTGETTGAPAAAPPAAQGAK